MEMRDEVVDVDVEESREGGSGKESAALKVWVVEVRRARTWRRVCRWERAAWVVVVASFSSFSFSFPVASASASSASLPSISREAVPFEGVMGG